MAETAAQTLAPQRQSSDVLTAAPSQSQTESINREKEVLFDSLIQERIEGSDASESSPLKTFMTGLLWFGYSVAIVVALVLVWSAASGLLKVF